MVNKTYPGRLLNKQVVKSDMQSLAEFEKKTPTQLDIGIVGWDLRKWHVQEYNIERPAIECCSPPRTKANNTFLIIYTFYIRQVLSSEYRSI